MNKLLATLTLGIMMMAPLATTATAADRTTGNLPAAVDQLLARDMIQQAQTHLQLAGFDPGRTDGVFDARTSEAVRSYQAAQGIPVSGLLDQPTRNAMFAGFQHDNEG
jgi:peptidoglycan hydrolase-like protein with peptidoglycan-binding domain